jgi:hypothetical protein
MSISSRFSGVKIPLTSGQYAPAAMRIIPSFWGSISDSGRYLSIQLVKDFIQLDDYHD